MEFKDYLRIFVRRWPWMVGCGVIVAVLLWSMSLWQAVPYYATMEVHFKKSPLELGYFEPDDYAYPITSNQARAQIFLHPDVLEKVAERLRKKNLAADANQIRGLVGVVPSSIDGTFTVRADHSNPAYPAEILQALYDAYIEYMTELYDGAYKKALERATKQAGESAKALEKATLELNGLRAADEGIYDVDIQSQIMANLIVDLERLRQQNRLDITKLDRQIANASTDERRLAEDELLRHHLPPYSYTGAEPGASSKRMRELETQLRALQKRYTETHPSIQAIHNEMSEIQADIAVELKNAVATKYAEMIERKQTLISSLELLDQILETEYRKLSGLRTFRNDQSTVRRKIELAQERKVKADDRVGLLDESKGRSADRVEQSMTKLRTSDATPVPVARRISIPLLLLLAVIVGVAAGFLVDYLADTLRTSIDVRSHLNIATIASLPYVRDEPVGLLQAATKSPVYEVYNKLAVFLDSMVQEKRAKTLLVTSTKAEEGKTTVSSNVAIALAQSGRRVILVDSDIRKPQVHMIFGLDNSRGLSTILSGEYGAEEELRAILDQGNGQGIDAYLQPTTVENLRAVTAGPVAPHPISLLKSETMRWFMNELKARADIVIFDSPPLMGVIDAAVLASMADLTVVVVAENAVKRAEAAQMKHALNQVGANIVGAVINKSRSRPEAYYYYYYRYRGYGS